MFELILSCVVSSIVLLSIGNLFCSYFFKDKISISKNFSEFSLFGIVALSFFALILNFFFPLNKLIGTLIIIISLILFFRYFSKTLFKKELVLYICYTSLLSFILLLLSNINRPDAGLYHLPYISMINENKIILGASNIHFRFGHISIIQYLSAIYNNFIFTTSIITVPLASLVSIFFIYLLNNFFIFIKDNKFIANFIFLIFIFSIFNFNRYSSLGNDAPGHIYFFILVIYFLQIYNIRECGNKIYSKILILSIFLAALKLFLVLIAIIPVSLFLLHKNKKKLAYNKTNLIFLLIGTLWILKNILVSGCLLYPVQKTCIKNLIYHNAEQTEEAVFVSEAWAKGWSDQKGVILNYEEYNKNFNWLKTWSNNHLKKIFEKILPFLIFLTLITIFHFIKYFFREKKIEYQKFNKKRFYQLFILNIFFLIFWFLKFPIYRYGLSFIALFLILILLILFSKIYIDNNRKYYTSIIILCFMGLFLKNGFRINDKINVFYNDYPWPKIYSLDINNKNIPNKFQLIKKNGFEVYYYSNQELCMYSKSPCSNYKLENLNSKKIGSYSIYFLN